MLLSHPCTTTVRTAFFSRKTHSPPSNTSLRPIAHDTRCIYDDDTGGVSSSSELAIEHCQGQMTQITKSIVFGLK